MLHEFVVMHRDELIKRCRAKVSCRKAPPVTPSELEYGVPLFLGQLVEALRCEALLAPGSPATDAAPGRSAASAESSRIAALHGRALHERGYTLGQVVHDYGDICQSVTELAREIQAPVTVGEFHTLNRLLDSAIADAVSSYGRRGEYLAARSTLDLHERMGHLADEQRRALATALEALHAIKLGSIGLQGATGTLLEDSLHKLRDLIDKSLPEIRLATGMTSLPKP